MPHSNRPPPSGSDRKRSTTDRCSSVSGRGDSSSATQADVLSDPPGAASDFRCRRIRPLLSRLLTIPDGKPCARRSRCQAPPPLRSSSASSSSCLAAFRVEGGSAGPHRSTHHNWRETGPGQGRCPSHPGGNAALSMRKELVWQRAAMASSHDRQDGSTAARCTSSSTGLSRATLQSAAFAPASIGRQPVTSPCNRRPRRRTATRSPSPTPRLRLSQ